MANEVRLVDADELLNSFRPEDEKLPLMAGLMRDVKRMVGEHICNLPTIDPESLRPKGRWVYDEGNLEWACSECLCAAHVSFGAISGYILSGFCPNCGAKMEG